MFVGSSLLFLSGCASRQPQNPPSTVTIKNNAPKPLSVSPKDTKEHLSKLILGYGDTISIVVFNQEKLSTKHTVDFSGVAILPLIGDTFIYNKDVQSLRQELTKRYSNYLVDPQIIIKVESIASQKYAVLGEVKTTGIFPFAVPVPLSEAIAMAGGIGNDGQAESVLLVRRTETGGTVSEIDVASIMRNGNFAADLQIQNGDIIFVPQKKLAITANFMEKVGKILSPILSLQRAIALWPAMVEALNNTESGTTVIIGN